MRTLLPLVTFSTLLAMPAPFAAADTPQDSAGDAGDCRLCSKQDQDRLLSSQTGLLSDVLDRILPGQADATDVYFLGFAGNGDEAVFANEVRFAEQRVAERFSTDGRSAVLATSADEVTSMPLASTDNLFQSISALGSRMNVEDDILFLFLSSHGSRDAALQVSLADLPLGQLRAGDLRAALDRAGIQWRIIVISACYSGSFIEPLKTRRTVIMTAAAAGNQSYGCAPDNDLTDFGRALFGDAFGSGNGLLDDFRITRSIIAEREKLEGAKPSKPQTYVGFEMEQKLKQIAGAL